MTSILSCFSLFHLESAQVYKYLQEKNSRNIFGKDYFSFEQLKCLLISCTPGLYETQHCQVLPV